MNDTPSMVYSSLEIARDIKKIVEPMLNADQMKIVEQTIDSLNSSGNSPGGMPLIKKAVDLAKMAISNCTHVVKTAATRLSWVWGHSTFRRARLTTVGSG